MGGQHLFYGHVASPIGLIVVQASDRAVVGISFVEDQRQAPDASGKPSTILSDALLQLVEYFTGRRRSFNLVLELRGTPFQRLVWRTVQTVPYGGTVSYGTIATAIGNPGAVRAVGAANGANPLPIIVPCHRIVGSNGALTGYGGGLWRKAWLLEHESANLG